MKGRLRIAVVMAVFMIAIVALPAFAHAATFTGEYPWSTQTLPHTPLYFVQPAVVGVTVLNTAAIKPKTAVITIDGVSYKTFIDNAGTVLGSWSFAYGTPVNGVYPITWTWTAGAGAADTATLYCFPTTTFSTSATHTVTASFTDVNGTVQTDPNIWSFNTSSAPGAPGATGVIFGTQAPLAASTITTTTPAISVAVSDLATLSVNTTASINGVAVNSSKIAANSKSGSIVCSLPVGGLLDSQVNVISVTATDALGARATSTWSFTVLTSTACTRCHSGWSTDPDMGPNCQSCHVGKVWPHANLLTGSSVESEFNTSDASRHNVSDVGFGGTTAIGMKSRFDGTQGGVLLVDTAGNSVTATFPVPTANVFKAGALDDNNNQMGPNSVISCDDCHSGMNTPVVGPHGAASAQWLIDPNYPAPYIMAVNSHTTVSGMKVRASLADTTTASLMDASNAGSSYAVICAKCHDLWDETSVGTSHPTGVSNASNTAHASHHLDANNGEADCINCHIAIPHGWKRPRLLVNGYTGAFTTDTAGDHVSTADAYPYWQGRGAINHTLAGVNVGFGPISTGDIHSLNASGGVTWAENDCIACGDHSGVATDPSKLK
jgi:hypothetical protein